MSKPSEDRTAEEARAFLAGFKTLVLSTSGPSGEPEASYAPFVRTADNGFHIYVSDLARHSRNLKSSRLASVLLIEDEATASELFARRRLTFRCRVEAMRRGSAPWVEILDLFEVKFGAVMDLIRPLEDFNLFRLRPLSGTYVRGFAQAYRFSGPALESLRHINDLGHRGPRARGEAT